MGKPNEQETPRETQLFYDAFKASPVGIAVENLEGQPLFVNPALSSMLGFSEEEMRSKHCVDFSPPEDADKDWALFQQLRAGSIDHYHIEKRFLRRDGSLVWGRLSISLLNGRPSPLVVAMVEDITDKRKSEEALHASEERLRLAQSVARIGTFEWNIRTGSVWTPELQAIYGLQPGGRDGTHPNFEKLVHPDDRARMRELTDLALKTGKPIDGEFRIVWPDGSVHWINGRAQVIFDDSGQPSRMVGVNVDITERKMADEARFRHAAIVESSDDAVTSLSLDGVIVSWNAAAERIFGFTETEAVGQPISILTPPELRDDESKILQRLRAGERIEHLETIRVTKVGKKVDISVTVSPIKDATGRVVGVSKIARDISDRKRQEEKLREYERAVENAEEMIAVVDREYRYLIANRQFLKLRNMTREQVVGNFVRDVLQEGVFEAVVKPKLDECFQGRVVRYELKYSYAGLGERDVLASYFPIEGANGIDRIACILQDITDRKRAEEALLKMNRTLEAQGSLLRSREELLRVFVKNVPVPVAMFDREMRYLEVSDRWCTTYSVDSSQILGSSHYDIFPELPDRYKEIHRRVLAGEIIRADEDRWDREGGTTWTRWEVRPWKTPEGAVGGILIFAEDITRRKQMEEALSDMSRKLIESQEQERARIGRELHDDINQRLAMLSLELAQLQENPSELQPRVKELRRQVVEVSNDIQALSHDLHSSKLEYLGVVAGMKSWCKEFAERQKLEIDFRSDVSSVLPLAVGLSLFRVLQEALNNAIKHSGVKRIEVHLREDPGEVQLVISDLGRGFDVEAASQGKGLGLTSMRERVRLVNGAISVESKPMGGTTIHVRVPLESTYATKQEAV